MLPASNFRLPKARASLLLLNAKREQKLVIAKRWVTTISKSRCGNRTTKVLRRAFFKRRFLSDGYRFDGIEIDTANYTIAPNLRAIGLRANYHIDLGFTSSQSLTLFVPSGTTYKEVLSNADMVISFTKTWPSCTNETRDATRSVSISKEISEGYFDLIVRESLVDAREHKGLRPGDDCVTNIEHKETKTYTLRFKGRHYVIPTEMREFDCRIC